MNAEIYTDKENKYQWELWDGPDGIEQAKGTAETLGECFEKIVDARQIIAREYT